MRFDRVLTIAILAAIAVAYGIRALRSVRTRQARA